MLWEVLLYITILLLGASFSWFLLRCGQTYPMVDRSYRFGIRSDILDSKYRFVVIPATIGKVLNKTHRALQSLAYDYTAPLIMLASLGLLAFGLGIVLKAWDKKKGLGLELPNIKD